MENQDIELKTVESPEESSTANNDKIEQLERLVKQQSDLIDKLAKQQEITNKVNEQISKNIKSQLTSKVEENKNPYQWVDDVLNNFNPVGVDPSNFERAKMIGGGLNDKIATFYVQALKHFEKLDSKGIAQRVQRVMETAHNY